MKKINDLYDVNLEVLNDEQFGEGVIEKLHDLLEDHENRSKLWMEFQDLMNENSTDASAYANILVQTIDFREKRKKTITNIFKKEVIFDPYEYVCYFTFTNKKAEKDFSDLTKEEILNLL